MEIRISKKNRFNPMSLGRAFIWGWAIMLFTMAQPVRGQDGPVLDPAFAPVIESRPPSSPPVYVHAVQLDGKILVGGLFGVIGGKVRKNFARLNSSGNTDETFTVGTGTDSSVNAIAVQSDGRIIIGGFFTSYNNVPRSYLARLNSDGSLDTSFSAVLNNVVYEIVIQPDGQVLVGGEFTSVNETTVNHIARLNSDGSLDGSFTSINSEVSNPVRAIALQPNGKIMIGGETVGGADRRSFLRLNQNGSTDTNFNKGSGFSGGVYEIVIQPDGKYLVGGSFNGFNNAPAPNNIARINFDGTLDSGFASGLSPFDVIKRIALATDGTLFVVGNFTFYNDTPTRGIVKLNPNGSLDTSFNTGGGVDVANPISSVNILANGKVLLSGFFGFYANTMHAGIVKINPNGTSDETFAPRLGNVGSVSDIAATTGGAFVVVGNFSYINNVPREKVARLLSDGKVDPSFDPGTGVDGVVSSVLVGSDQKILIGGNFRTVSGVPRDNIARLKSNGTLDKSFDAGPMDEFGVVDDVAQSSSGKIVLGGSFSSINGATSNFLAQLNSDGSIDPGFSHPILDGRVRTLLPQPHDKLFIGGGIFTISEPQGFYRGIARLDSLGSMDNTFETGTGANGFVLSLAQQADGRLIIGGGFLSYNGVKRQGIARLNLDGSLDTSFNPGSGALGQINELAIDLRGRIFAAGKFQSFDGTHVGNIVSLSPNGTLNRSFLVGGGSDSRVTALAMRDENSILVGCGSSFDGKPRGGLAQLNNIPAVPPAAMISGRVVTPDGRGLRNTAVFLTDSTGAHTIATTSSFGVFTFEGIPSGQTYLLTVRSKRYRFGPATVRLEGNTTLQDLVGLE